MEPLEPILLTWAEGVASSNLAAPTKVSNPINVKITVMPKNNHQSFGSAAVIILAIAGLLVSARPGGL
mgnify:CR=1 FL=1